MKKIGVLNCTSQYGLQMIKTILQDQEIDLAGGSVRSSNPHKDKDLGQLISGDPIGLNALTDAGIVCQNANAVIDFSHPGAIEGHLKACMEQNTPIVFGTTGLQKEHYQLLENAARKFPVLHATNMSLGVTFLTIMTKMLAEKLPGFDIEILDFHHSRKQDAPSGTALSIGKEAAKVRGETFEDVAVMARSAHDKPRQKGEIGFASLRGGTVTADCQVIFAGEGERIELVHRADSSEIFSKGAVLAAKWLSDQQPGLYNMQDVFDV